MLDVTFVDLVASFADKLPTVKHFIIMTDAEHMPKKPMPPNIYCYETLLEAELRNLSKFQWTANDENAACGLCYTSGTTGNPKVDPEELHFQFYGHSFLCKPLCIVRL